MKTALSSNPTSEQISSVDTMALVVMNARERKKSKDLDGPATKSQIENPETMMLVVRHRRQQDSMKQTTEEILECLEDERGDLMLTIATVIVAVSVLIASIIGILV